MATDAGKFNRLIGESSPYLLQHAHNPVDWYPWGDEAFEKARVEDKPVFLSIGYSTCHWCHVMEEESFEDTQVAEALNRDFIAVKVDREERPDIDAVYMDVCQALTGNGGWPLTIFMTDTQKPFFAGTYFPKHSRYGAPGFLELLAAVTKQWKSDRKRLVEAGDQITQSIRKRSIKTDNALKKELIVSAKKYLAQIFDRKNGGFGLQPKFPTPHHLLFLLRYSVLEQDAHALEMVEKTLRQMYRGGDFDHIGFGFSRYSTDEKWLVPHFEKMLYDNALLSMAYLETFQVTHKEVYRRVAEKTLHYVLREMTNADGGFYSAQDADSEGVEGKYYVFTRDEIVRLLGEADGRYFSDYFHITQEGNFEGKNIPNLIKNEEFERVDKKIESLLQRVYDYRLTRTALRKDDKILTAWNGLMIGAFAKAYQIVGDETYLAAAEKAMSGIEEKLTDGGTLRVSYREGRATGTGYLDDYAFVAWALLELYQATFRAEYLGKAVAYCETMVKLFWDDTNDGFFLNGGSSERLILRPKETYDGAMPSGNSAAAYVLLRLAKLTGDPKLEKLAHRQLEFLAGTGMKYPAGCTFGLIVGMLALYPSKEIVCVTKDDGEQNKVRNMLRDRFIPNVSILIKDITCSQTIERIAEFVKPYGQIDDQMTFYCCENNLCSSPVTELEEIIKKL